MTVHLERMSAAHADALFRISKDPAVKRYMGQAADNLEEFISNLKSLEKLPFDREAEARAWAIICVETNSAVGFIEVRAGADSPPRVSLCVAAESRLRGVATLALSEIIVRLRDERQTVIEAVVDAANHPSIRLLAKLGFTHVRTVTMPTGPDTDMVEYIYQLKVQ